MGTVTDRRAAVKACTWMYAKRSTAWAIRTVAWQYFQNAGQKFSKHGQKKYNSFCPVSMLSTLGPTAFEFVFALEIGFNSVCESVSGV